MYHPHSVFGGDQLYPVALLQNAINGVQGVVVSVDPFTNATLINFGNDANGGEVVAITLAGIVDPATVNLTVI